jgi:hypothetical protein
MVTLKNLKDMDAVRKRFWKNRRPELYDILVQKSEKKMNSEEDFPDFP